MDNTKENVLRLLFIAKQKGVKISHLNELIGGYRGKLTDVKNGKSTLKQDEFDILRDFLMSDEFDHLSPTTASKSKIRIPVLGRVQAGLPIEAVENIIDYEEISEKMAKKGEYFALQIRGASMQPRMFEGDVVIVLKQPVVESGETAIVMVKNELATCKVVNYHEGGITLISHNKTFEPMFYSNSQIKSLPVTILGKAVEIRGKL